jgi:nucleotide-binding universal stress UspA family protein
MAFAFRRMLFPTDFSEASRVAGRMAAALARESGAQLTLLHVVPPVTDPSPSPTLAALATELAPGMSVTTEVLSGLPASRIVEYAQRRGVDLIVMGTHGRTGLSAALLGSVAEAVVRRAPCPVLTVPATRPAPEATAIVEPTASCVVCRGTSVDLICEPCRARIRGQALETKRREERAGRA